MTPVGHAAASVLLARWRNWPVAATIIGGVAPDIDFVLLPYGGFNELHRVVTHNLLFVLLVAAACAAFARHERWLSAVAATVGGLLHLAIDSMLDSNASNGIGVALFWPFSSTPYSLVNLASLDCAAGWHDIRQMVACGLPMLLWELPLWAFAALALWWPQRATRRVTVSSGRLHDLERQQ
jgi:hypothetical protein